MIESDHSHILAPISPFSLETAPLSEEGPADLSGQATSHFVSTHSSSSESNNAYKVELFDFSSDRNEVKGTSTSRSLFRDALFGPHRQPGPSETPTKESAETDIKEAKRMSVKALLNMLDKICVDKTVLLQEPNVQLEQDIQESLYEAEENARNDEYKEIIELGDVRTDYETRSQRETQDDDDDVIYIGRYAPLGSDSLSGEIESSSTCSSSSSSSSSSSLPVLLLPVLLFLV